MKNYALSMLLGAAFISGTSALGYNPENLVFSKNDKVLKNVIFKDGNFTISQIKERMPQEIKESNLYYIKVKDQKVRRQVTAITPTIYRDDQHLVIESKDMSVVERISSILHESDEIFCGGVQWISNSPQILKADKFPSEFHASNIKLDDKVVKLLEEVSGEKQKGIVETLENFGTRHANTSIGEKSSNWIADQLKDIAEGRDDIEFEQIANRRSNQKSVIARIKGQKNPENIVILGAHIDSTAFWNKNNAPGADDNATGTAALMEAFRIIVESGLRFEHSLEFHGYAAEELGLIGSSELAAQYRNEDRKVLSMVQLDMNGYLKSGNQAKVTLVSNNTNSDLTNSLGRMAELYIDIPFDIKPLNGGSSDHAAWNRQGFPAAFPTEDTDNFNRKIHSPSDTSDILDFELSSQFTKLVISYLSHVGVII